MRARLPVLDASSGVSSERAAKGRFARRRGGLLRLQRSAGNAAVTALLARRTARDPVDRAARSPTRTRMQRASLGGELTELLTGARRDRRIVQRDLAADIRASVDIVGPVDYHGLIRLIRAASVADRRAVLADTALMRLIGTRINPVWATTVASALLEGTHKWRNPPGNDFFRFFVQGTGSGPANPSSTMNCWESIMYAAYLTGAVSAAWIKSFYLTALAQPDANAAIWALLGWSTALPTYNPAAGREPTTGQLVFYRTGSSGVPGHVAIYMGGGQIMSLWTRPRGIDHIQQVGIREIAGTIYYGDTPW